MLHHQSLNIAGLIRGVHYRFAYSRGDSEKKGLRGILRAVVATIRKSILGEKGKWEGREREPWRKVHAYGRNQVW